MGYADSVGIRSEESRLSLGLNLVNGPNDSVFFVTSVFSLVAVGSFEIFGVFKDDFDLPIASDAAAVVLEYYRPKDCGLGEVGVVGGDFFFEFLELGVGEEHEVVVPRLVAAANEELVEKVSDAILRAIDTRKLAEGIVGLTKLRLSVALFGDLHGDEVVLAGHDLVLERLAGGGLAWDFP